MRSARSLTTVRAAVGDKREAILRAAISVFAHNGYFNSKVADIAREAGVADGTVYLYFKSKEEILHSIFDRSVEEAIAAARKQIERISDPREKLRQIALLHLERLGADRDLAVVFQVELRGSTKFMEEFSAAGFAEYLALIRSTFEEGQQRGCVSCRSERQSRGEDSLRRARRNGHQLDSLQASLQAGADGRSGAGHFSERSEGEVNRAAEYIDVQRRALRFAGLLAPDEPVTLVDVFIGVAREHKRPDTLELQKRRSLDFDLVRRDARARAGTLPPDFMRSV